MQDLSHQWVALAQAQIDEQVAIGKALIGAKSIKEVVDLSSSAAPTVLVSQAYANFLVTSDQKTLVYSWNFAPGPLAGLWTMPVP